MNESTSICKAILAEISTVDASFCKVRTRVPLSVWHFPRLRIFHCNEYRVVAIYGSSCDILP